MLDLHRAATQRSLLACVAALLALRLVFVYLSPHKFSALADLPSSIGPAKRVSNPVTARGATGHLNLHVPPDAVPRRARATAIVGSSPEKDVASKSAVVEVQARTDAATVGTSAGRASTPARTRDAQCASPFNVSQGHFEVAIWKFDGPCASSGLTQWFDTAEQVCEELQHVKIDIIGQSTERRLLFTLQEMLLGNPFALENGRPQDPMQQHLFDSKNFAEDLFMRKPDSAFAAKHRDCSQITLTFERWGTDVLAKVKSLVESAPPYRAGERRHVIVFTFGLYVFAGGTYVSARSTAANSRLQAFLSGDTVQMAKEKGIVLVWRPPAPVNAAKARFKTYQKGGRDVNDLILGYRDYTSDLFLERQICIFDTFDPVMSGSAAGLIKFETGKEWKPPQFGGIHMLDTGRRLVAQLFLNSLRYCLSEQEEREKGVPDQVDA